MVWSHILRRDIENPCVPIAKEVCIDRRDGSGFLCVSRQGVTNHREIIAEELGVMGEIFTMTVGESTPK